MIAVFSSQAFAAAFAILVLGLLVKAFALRLSVGLVRAWVWLYTSTLPRKVREGRRSKIRSDLWEQRDESRDAGYSPEVTAIHILARLLMGIPSDVTWRLRLMSLESALLDFAAYAAVIVLAGLGSVTAFMSVSAASAMNLPLGKQLLIGGFAILLVRSLGADVATKRRAVYLHPTFVRWFWLIRWLFLMGDYEAFTMILTTGTSSRSHCPACSTRAGALWLAAPLHRS